VDNPTNNNLKKQRYQHSGRQHQRNNLKTHLVQHVWLARRHTRRGVHPTPCLLFVVGFDHLLVFPRATVLGRPIADWSWHYCPSTDRRASSASALRCSYFRSCLTEQNHRVRYVLPSSCVPGSLSQPGILHTSRLIARPHIRRKGNNSRRSAYARTVGNESVWSVRTFRGVLLPYIRIDLATTYNYLL